MILPDIIGSLFKIMPTLQPPSLFVIKESFCMVCSSTSGFDNLKRAITEGLVLALLAFSQPFVLETDASGMGIDFMLSQKGHLIGFFLKKMQLKM